MAYTLQLVMGTFEKFRNNWKNIPAFQKVIALPFTFSCFPCFIFITKNTAD